MKQTEDYSRPWNWKEDHDLSIWLHPSDDALMLGEKWKGRRRFLDFGCGLGRHSLYFASLGYRVKGFDLSLDAVESTKKLLGEHGFAGEIIQSDMHHVGFPSSCCDCLLAYHVCSHTTLEGIGKVIGEIYRLLDKGGSCFLDLCSEDCYTALAGYPRIDECTVRKVGGEEDGIPHCCLDRKRVIALFKDFQEVYIEKRDIVYEKGKELDAGGHYWIYATK